MLSLGAGEDSVLEGFWFQATTRAGGLCVQAPPGWVSGKLTFPRSHLMNSPCKDFAHTHKGGWILGGGVVVVPWRWEAASAFIKEGLSYPFVQGGVRVVDY